MLIMSFTSILIFTITSIVMVSASILSKKTFNDREKSSPFECGFDPKSSARLPFSLQFFMIAMIFLIFDVEITLLLPMIYVIKLSNLMNLFMNMNFFVLILLWGLYHEWNQGALSWMK